MIFPYCIFSTIVKVKYERRQDLSLRSSYNWRRLLSNIQIQIQIQIQKQKQIQIQIQIQISNVQMEVHFHWQWAGKYFGWDKKTTVQHFKDLGFGIIKISKLLGSLLICLLMISILNSRTTSTWLWTQSQFAHD